MNVELAAAARKAALETYAKAHDHFSEQEQRAVGDHRAIEAAGYHEYAVRALRAYRAELDDPRPEEEA